MERKGEMKSSGILLIHAVMAFVIGSLSLSARYILRPVKRGFFCADTSIRLPYRSSSIPFSSLSLISFPIILAELYVRSRKLICYKERYEVKGRILDVTLVRVVQFLLWFASFVKNSTGRLRPHFLDVCKPDVDLNNCSASQFIEDYACTLPESSSKVIDSRLSFFSGHSSSAFYCAAFLVVYLHSSVGRFAVSWTPIFVLIYSIFLIAAALVAISRVLDHKHHSSDVVVGAVVGIVMACLMLYCNQHLLAVHRASFQKNTVGDESDPSQVDSSQRSDNKTAIQSLV